MKSLTVNQLAAATECTLLRASLLLAPLQSAMAKHGINTSKRAAAFLAQLSVESARLTRLEENMKYSAERLVAVWPRRFKSVADARQFANNAEALANYVYAGRMGNSAPGDGYRYRGRGFIQLTGKANYRAFSLASGVDVVANPDRLLEPKHAAESAAWFWQSNGCNELADAGDYVRISKRVTGGTHALSERIALTTTALAHIS
ncbi:glycoside hydrolase family 19 protein [Malikia spinosa]|uniref:Glycoside hydrolase family 19 protein n=1 Tax=Malikia spinosa TaxID=86180 RepID=A0A7C9JNU0_9BURK|nr:glycoside hydrolase family 19 protein [Malikia spinosa]MYZ53686.1 glycoside hydrolase family 19 protein [Malikia spinosa]